jgi:hypothetical protein
MNETKEETFFSYDMLLMWSYKGQLNPDKVDFTEFEIMLQN